MSAPTPSPRGEDLELLETSFHECVVDVLRYELGIRSALQDRCSVDRVDAEDAFHLVER
jgi:hypothetical protein